MTDREKKLWSWAGKLALVAIPAAISGYASFKKAEVEAKMRSEAAYTALRTAFEAQQRDFEDLQRQTFAIEGQVSLLQNLLAHPKTVTVPTKSSGATERDGDGLRDDWREDAGLRLKTRATLPAFRSAEALPAKFDDMVRQYAPKK